ncbi:MAG: hypothetical protein MUF54_04970 [Polyangiaceae bacterium]|jgi:hypothetical protein|nr:hypothetical protein [Polyangiaceae bacterium]
MFPEHDDRFDLGEDRDADRKRFAERLVPELIKRFVDAGVGKLSEQPENLRHFVQELRLPKEIASYLFAQIDETKSGLYRVVAREIRDFLEHTNIADEVTRALTKLSFEIRTEIRFVPNDSASQLFPKPEVQSEVVRREDGKKKPVAKKEEPPRKRSR